jgi:hypothetical protein
MKPEPAELPPPSAIIEFLERMGRDALLRGASAAEIQDALTQAGLPSDLWTVISSLEPSALESLVGARSNVCCMIYSPDKEDEEEEEETEEPPEEEAEEEIEKDDKVKKSLDRVRRIA